MKELFTRKLYYKKYDRRLAIRCRKNPSDHKSPTPEVVTWLMDRQYAKKWRGVQSTSYNDGFWWKTDNIRQNTYTIFFKDETVFGYLKEVIGEEFFDEYEKPMDNQHTQLLETEKVITRKMLFHDLYRYAIRVPQNKGGKKLPTGTLSEIADWCTSQFGPERNNQKVYKIHQWTNGTYYFADVKDAVMFKMVWGEYVGATERVVLISEMEAARVTSAAV